MSGDRPLTVIRLLEKLMQIANDEATICICSRQPDGRTVTTTAHRVQLFDNGTVIIEGDA